LDKSEDTALIDYRVLSEKDYREKHGYGLSGVHYVDESGTHIVEVPKGASTKTRMHEIAHAKLGHETKEIVTFHETAQKELEADAWVYEKLGSDPTWMEIISDFAPLVRELFVEGYKPTPVFNWVRKEIEEAGYEIDGDEKSRLWWTVRNLYKEYREKRR